LEILGIVRFYFESYAFILNRTLWTRPL
jgi:hypothetical protein